MKTFWTGFEKQAAEKKEPHKHLSSVTGWGMGAVAGNKAARHLTGTTFAKAHNWPEVLTHGVMALGGAGLGSRAGGLLKQKHQEAEAKLNK